MEQATISVNGVITTATDAVVPVLDHGFLYGEGIYETLRTYNQKPFLIDRHLARLRASAKQIDLPLPYTDEEIAESIAKTMKSAAIESEQYIRVMLTRGVGELSYDSSVCHQTTIVIIVKPHHGSTHYEQTEGIKVIVSSIIRNHPQSVNPQIKSNNLLNNALAMQEAINAGASEALMRNYRGEISECAQSNFFIVKNRKLHTPPLESGLLEGITRNYILEIAQSLGFTVAETILTDNDLFTADEMFITSTTREVLAISRLDDRIIGSGKAGPVTTQLTQSFQSRAAKV